jgi:protein SCO1/2
MRIPNLSRLLPLLAAFILAACQADPGPPPLEGARLGGPFTLTAQDGRRVSDRDFAGKYRLVYFGFTFCPDICPTDLQQIGAAMRRLEERDPALAARVQPLFVTVDPARDTPEVMRRYAANFHPRIIGLTGSEEEIARMARAYGVYYQRAEPDASGAYAVDHSRNTILYGPDGLPIVIVPVDQGADAIVAELERWVR